MRDDCLIYIISNVFLIRSENYGNSESIGMDGLKEGFDLIKKDKNVAALGKFVFLYDLIIDHYDVI
jgi:hypothetical protein